VEDEIEHGFVNLIILVNVEDSFAKDVHVNVDGVVKKDLVVNVGFVKKKKTNVDKTNVGGVIANVSTPMFKVVGILNALFQIHFLASKDLRL